MRRAARTGWFRVSFASEQSRRPEEKDRDEDSEAVGIAKGRRKEDGSHRFDDAEDDTAPQRAHEASDAAEDGGLHSFQPVDAAHGRLQREEARVQTAGE